MKIEVTRRNAVNLKMFLEGLGYKTAFNLTPNNEIVELLVNQENDFLTKTAEYINTSGFIPYHYTVSPSTKGSADTVLPFKGKITQVNSFTGVSGPFKLVLFEGKNNFLWKTYSEVTLPPTEVTVSGKYVTSFLGINGEVLNLINYVRIK